jgi:hypothetical protein
MFKTASRNQSKLRMTIDGPAGSGKTYTALRFAHVLANGGKIAFIDTERGSASKYVGEAPDDGIPWQFDVVNLTNFSPDRYTELIELAGKSGYSVLVIDSLSHAWEGVGGALEIKDKASAAGKNNDYTAWRKVTPLHNRMVDAILQSPCHIITTMRSRMDYVQDVNEFGKVTGIRKIGMAPIQRPGMEYEMDIVCDMDWSHIMTVSKSRCSAVADMKVEKPGPAFMTKVTEWLESATSTEQPTQVFVPVATQANPVITLDDLMARYSVEDIMSANGGQIPASDEEVAAIAELLKAA